MKSGRNVQVHIDLADYNDLHLSDNCRGAFRPSFVGGSYLDSSVLGPIQVPVIPMIRCENCGASFITPGFEEWIEGQIADHLVRHNGLLSKQQLRFLRQHFDLTQDQVARLLGIADRHEVAKMESPKNPRQMDPDKQLRLKLHYAKFSDGINVNDILALAEPTEAPIKIDQNWFDIDEIRRRFTG